MAYSVRSTNEANEMLSKGHTENIGPELQIIPVLGELLHRGKHNACIVDQHMELLFLRHELFCGRLDRGKIGQVKREMDSYFARRSPQVRDSIGCFRMVASGEIDF